MRFALIESVVMAVELVSLYSGTIASGASTCTSIDVMKSWSRIYAEISSMSTNAALTVLASSDNITFRPVYEKAVSSGLLGSVLDLLTMVVASSGANGFSPIVSGFRYYQFRASAVISGGARINLICNDG